MIYPGLHYLDVSNGNGANVTIPCMVEAATTVVVKAPPKRTA